MAHDPLLDAHKRWLGFLQPVGLVVSPHALVTAGAVPCEQVTDLQRRLQALARRPALPGDPGPIFGPIADFPRLAFEVLGLRPADLAGAPGGPDLPDALAVALPDFGETLRPTYAIVDAKAGGAPLILVDTWPEGTDLDQTREIEHGWDAAPQARHERLLRELASPIGLTFTGDHLRLTYAPRGETSGHLTFPIAAMCEVAGRPILAALEMLLGADRLFLEAESRRLPALLAESRKYQSVVSTRLAEQVLGALLELLRGFSAADAEARGALLGALSREDPQHVYGGLLTVLLRLVFLLYAEDQGLMPQGPIYGESYAVTGLYERLREDAGRYPDTMDQRFGAWPWLCSLFRLVYTGGSHNALHLPARAGQLFDPDAYPFLEGRSRAGGWQPGERLDPPRIADGCLFRILQGLLVLDGERLSYRALDVEQIGSVYESMMGFELARAAGPSIALRPHHVVVDLGALVAMKAGERAKHLAEVAGCKLSAKAEGELKAATTAEEAAEALERGRKVSPRAPGILPPGALFLQPGEERRRSGSHYTPRSLTGPIVETTLRPILEGLGEAPRAEQLLGLKICDPAMGSGAFLVEACRQLAERVVRAWGRHGETPAIPADEDPLLHARRLVAQRCLYGVDKNPFAVDLAKLSLWLVTLAREHPFTFVDHALKHGDSLVGLTKGQIAEFRWDQEVRFAGPLFERTLRTVSAAQGLREELQGLGEDEDLEKRDRLRRADEGTEALRLRGDAVVYAFFKGGVKEKEREKARERVLEVVEAAERGERGAAAELRGMAEALREGARGIEPFHWEVEFPEVFGRERAGFDAFVGNPPFLGGTRISTEFGMPYFSWLTLHYPPAGHLCDLVAYFFRRTFQLLRRDGSLGLIATNTLAQGDTRVGGLGAIVKQGGTIHAASRRLKWPGDAAVIVSTAHIFKGSYSGERLLDGRPAPIISAFLFPRGSSEEPARLVGMNEVFSAGSKIYGQGFLFDDDDPEASPISLMDKIVANDPGCRSRIFPYVGGQDINQDNSFSPRRYVIQLSDVAEERDLSPWSPLARIVRERVKPERDKLGSNPNNTPLKRRWWAYQAHRPDLYRGLARLHRAVVASQVSSHFAFNFYPANVIFAHTVNVFLSDALAFFATLQSRPHEIWARFFASSLEDRLRYTPTDCFETFPFPPNWQSDPALEAAGKTYYEYRADLMVRHDEGLTRTYNRFHDPDEDSPAIVRLRELHAAMDRAVLGAYGWADLAERATCEFLLDYEEDDDEDDDAPARARKRKKPWRLRWPQELHDEVLARLLALNQERAEHERQAGLTADAAKAKAGGKKKAKKKAAKKAAKGKKATGAPAQVGLGLEED